METSPHGNAQRRMVLTSRFTFLGYNTKNIISETAVGPEYRLYGENMLGTVLPIKPFGSNAAGTFCFARGELDLAAMTDQMQ
jgi:hypothetical protein